MEVEALVLHLFLLLQEILVGEVEHQPHILEEVTTTEEMVETPITLMVILVITLMVVVGTLF
jgi:hypothetical protein